MYVKLEEQNIAQINSILNELPIKSLPIAQSIMKIMDECKVEEANEKSPEKKK